MSAAYRIRQFVGALKARVEPTETQVLDRYLNPAQKRLFLSMAPQYQRHSLDVFNHLVEAGCGERELLQAALLHDVGKNVVGKGGIGVGHRVASVVLRKIWPSLLDRLASPAGQSWRQRFWAHERHGELGAAMIAKAGGTARLISLVRHHHNPALADDPLAEVLYRADGAN